MLLTPPIVSHEDICFIKLFSLVSSTREKASAIVTDSGSPSGTAITTIVTPIRKKLIISLYYYINRASFNNDFKAPKEYSNQNLLFLKLFVRSG